MTRPKHTPSQEVQYLLQARHSLLWVTTAEERRAERAIVLAAQKAGYHAVLWDCASGCQTFDGQRIDIGEFWSNPGAVFDMVRRGGVGVPTLNAADLETEKKTVWILRDLDAFLAEPILARGLKTLARDLQAEVNGNRLASVVVLTPSGEVPLTLRAAATVVDWPLPTRSELEGVLDEIVRESRCKVNGERSAIVDAAAGLPEEDAVNAMAYSLASLKRIDPTVVSGRKKAVIDKERVLTWYEPDKRGLDAIGGLGLLKRWLQERQMALTPAAREYGLPAPKGLFLTGPPGNGKSLTAKAVAAAWGNLPLLKMDMGALKGGLVGQSEGNIRRALRIAEAVAPCVLWVDEIEKALAGSGGHGDSGVAADQLGTLLTWLQEHEGAVFVVATSNDPLALPPELTRKGRFDEIFFVDLPGRSDRWQVLVSSLTRAGLTAEFFSTSDVHALAAATEGFSGAEVAELVPAAMFTAFADGARPLRTEDLLQAARQTVPVSRSRAEHISALRAWAATRARPAAEVESNPSQSTPRPVAASAGRFAGIEQGDPL